MIFVVEVPENIYNKYCEHVQKTLDEGQVKNPITSQIVLKYILNNNKTNDVSIYSEMNKIKEIFIKYDGML